MSEGARPNAVFAARTLVRTRDLSFGERPVRVYGIKFAALVGTSAAAAVVAAGSPSATSCGEDARGGDAGGVPACAMLGVLFVLRSGPALRGPGPSWAEEAIKQSQDLPD